MRTHIHTINRTCLHAIREQSLAGLDKDNKIDFGLDEKTIGTIKQFSDKNIERFANQCVLLLSLSLYDLNRIVEKALFSTSSFPSFKNNNIYINHALSIYISTLHELCSTNPKQASLRFGVSKELAEQLTQIPLDKLLSAMSQLNFNMRPKKGVCQYLTGESNSLSRARRIIASYTH
jgi:hypothetical protein